MTKYIRCKHCGSILKVVPTNTKSLQAAKRMENKSSVVAGDKSKKVHTIQAATFSKSSLTSEIENVLRSHGFLAGYDDLHSESYDGDEVYAITDFIIDNIEQIDENTYNARMIFRWSDTASYGNEDNCERAGFFVSRRLGEQEIFGGDAILRGVDSGYSWCPFNSTDNGGYSLSKFDLSSIIEGTENKGSDDEDSWPIPYIIFEISFTEEATDAFSKETPAKMDKVRELVNTVMGEYEDNDELFDYYDNLTDECIIKCDKVRSNGNKLAFNMEPQVEGTSEKDIADFIMDVIEDIVGDDVKYLTCKYRSGVYVVGENPKTTKF